MRYLPLTRLFWVVALALSPWVGCEKRESAAPVIQAAPEPQISPSGYRLLLDFEVGGGQPYYDRFLICPTWPGWMSGVTIAIGYDLGYNTRSAVAHDWHRLPQTDRERLLAVHGVKGKPAQALAAALSDIRIDWAEAESVFQSVSIVRYRDLAKRTYPGFDGLHRNAQAALVSLTFNRGNSMTGERRSEMREIRACVSRRDYAGMARWNRASIRLWKGTDVEVGMRRRREAEAALMESPE